MEINSKAEFISLNKQERFGNRLRVWDTIQAMYDDNYNGLIGIRGRKADMRTFVSHLPIDAVAGCLRRIIHENPQYEPKDFYFGESAPDKLLLIQGEYGHIGGHYLRYNCTPGLNMREAMASGFVDVNNVVALAMLQIYMTPYSWTDFCELREIYPNSIIEFGVYGREIGNLPQRNTIIWELRNY